MNKLKFYCEYLPKGIAKVLKDITKGDRDYRTHNNYLLIVGIIYLHQMSDDASYLHYSPLSREYWRTVLGSHYSKYLNRLIKEQVVQRSWVLHIDDVDNTSRVIGYRINPTFLQDDLTIVKYAGTISSSKSADILDTRAKGNDLLIKAGINPDLIQMKKNQALSWIGSDISKVVDTYLNNEYVNGVPKSLPVLVRIYAGGNDFFEIHVSVESAQKIAEEQGKKLLYYKDKFIIADLNKFKQIAMQNLSAHYNWQVKSFNPDSFNFSRNQNTLRVYSKLSSLATALLPFLRINGEYIQQADLKCSQFTLFANLINYYLNHSGNELIAKFKKKQVKSFVSKLVVVLDDHKDELPEEGLNTANPIVNDYITNDAYRFLCDALLSDFYSIIKNELNLPQRAHGKGIAFRTVFSKPKPENELVRQFRQLYPTVISIINDFKNKQGYNQFAIGLQRVEAEIFIDNIWKQAKKLNINCFTRHDSLLYPINKGNDVKKIIIDVFKSYDFIYRVEYEEFNTDEIMLRLINETDYIDNIRDFDEIFLYTMEHMNERKPDQKNNIDLLDQLQDVDLPEQKESDYFEYVGIDTLWGLYELKGITLKEKQAVEADIANLQSNFPIPQFQDGTNNLISKLIDLMND